MLAVSSIGINQVDKDGDNNREGTPSKMEAILEGEYRDFSEAHNLLDSIDLDDLFMDMHDGDASPDLEMDPDFLVKLVGPEVYRPSEANNRIKGANDSFTMVNSSMKESNKRKKSSVHTKRESSNNDNNSKQGKPKKAKVDWKPELHRKFVEAVEELGVDSSVPSKILELMGVESLTRHNIASHLQKYRSHIKHLLTKDKMATNWTQGRQMCGVIGVGKGANPSPWLSTTIMGVNPMNMHHPLTMRPLHVWGHPMARTPNLHGKLPMWPSSVWPPSPPQPPPDPSICHSPHQYRLTGTPVASIPPQAMYRPTHTNVSPAPTTPSSFLSQPSTNHDSIDTAIGDVLAKPWLPLPIGLKPPSVDSVLIELQRQGIPKIPPSSPPGFDR